MTALRMTVGLLWLVAFSGFSTPPVAPCEHVASTFAAFNQKAESCTALRAAPFDAASCRVSTKECTGADRATIEQFLGCVDLLPACGEGGERAWRDQFDACAAGARLSPGCSL